MIWGITGKPGAGKTYLAVKMALQALKQGTPVYSNLHIFGARYVSTIINTLNVRKGLIVMDELNVEAGSRNIKTLPPPVYRQWSQHRHRGLNLIWTAQTINRIDIIMRELSNEIYECHSIADKFYWYCSYQPEELINALGGVMVRKPLLKSFAGLGIFSKSIYSLYSSEEEIEIPPSLAQKLAREWGYVEKDIIKSPELNIPVVSEVKQHTLDFQKMKQDRAKGEDFKKRMKEYLLALAVRNRLVGGPTTNRTNRYMGVGADRIFRCDGLF